MINPKFENQINIGGNCFKPGRTEDQIREAIKRCTGITEDKICPVDLFLELGMD